MKLTAEKNEFCPHCKENTLSPFYDFYQLFELSHHSKEEDLKKMYKKLSLKYHPDVQNGDESLFIILNKGYEILSDPLKRTLYDQSLLLLRNEKKIENEKNSLKENVNEGMILKMLYEIFKNLHQQQKDPIVEGRRRKRMNLAMGFLLSLVLALIFSLSPFWIGALGLFLGLTSSQRINKTLFYLNDFFITFLAIKYTLQSHFNLLVTVSVALFLMLYFYLTQQWKQKMA